jgi:hypothetical protein
VAREVAARARGDPDRGCGVAGGVAVGCFVARLRRILSCPMGVMAPALVCRRSDGAAPPRAYPNLLVRMRPERSTSQAQPVET